MSLMQMRRQLSYSAPFIWDKYTETAPGQYEYVERIYSDTADYPYEGDKDGYHYVMVKGTVLRYVWDVYLDAVGYGFKEVSRPAGSVWPATPPKFWKSSYLFTSANYAFDTERGIYTLPGRYPDEWGYEYQGGELSRVFWTIGPIGEPSADHIYYGTTSPATEYEDYWEMYPTTLLTREVDMDHIIHTRGSSTGLIAEDVDAAAYPADGYDEDTGYYYVYKTSYIYTFDHR